MPVHIAFLRAINLGGRTVKMDVLRAAFEQLDVEDVWTFIASGNVVFRSRRAARTLEPRIERHLLDTFGWPVPTFLRTADELRAILKEAPFDPEDGTTHVVFMRSEISDQARTVLESVESGVDALRVRRSEVYWRIRGRMLDSALTAGHIEKVAGMPGTARNLNTVRRLVAKLDAG